MPRRKLIKIQDLKNWPNVIQMGQDDFKLKLQKFITATKPLILELGCGKAEQTIFLAQNNPQKLFIALDIQGERLWHGAKEASEKKLGNILFIRDYVENITNYLAPQSVQEIWLTFPDPFLAKSQSNKRLTHPRYLEIYQKLLVSASTVNLKTDELKLLQFSKQNLKNIKAKILAQEKNWHKKKNISLALQVQTTYEKKHLAQNKNIYYLKWRFN